MSSTLKDSTISMVSACIDGKNVLGYTVVQIVENEYGPVYSGYFELYKKIEHKYKLLLQKQEAFEKLGRLSVL